MHPALKFLLVFVSAVFIGDRAGAALLYHLVSFSQDRYVKLYLGRSPAEIVISGNSRAADQFPAIVMAKKLGVRVVNLGLGGISMVMSEVLLRDYVDRNGPPRLLIVEPTCLTVNPNDIGDMGLYTIFSERISQLVREREPVRHYTQQTFHLFSYNNENLVRVLYNVIQPQEDRQQEGSITPELVRIVRERAPIRLTDNPENEAALERILRFARERGIEVAIVASPYLREQLMNFVNYKEWLAELERRAGNQARVWDYAALFDGPRFFKDSVHLNAEGSSALLEVMLRDDVFNGLDTKAKDSGGAQP